MTARNRTLAMTISAVAILAGTIIAKPSPIYIWNSSESVPVGLYRLQPGQQPFRHRTRRRSTARAAGDLPGPKWLSADRSSDVEARAGASRANRLQNREHHYGRWHCDGRGAGARQSWPAVAGLGRVRRRRRRRALSHELAIGNLARRPLLRINAGNGDHWPCTSRLDKERLIVRAMGSWLAIPLFDRRRHHSSVPTNASQPPRAAAVQGGRTAGAKQLHPGRSRARWHARLLLGLPLVALWRLSRLQF